MAMCNVTFFNTALLYHRQQYDFFSEYMWFHFCHVQVEEAYDSRPKARLWDGEYSDSETEPEVDEKEQRNRDIDITHQLTTLPSK